MSLPRATWHPLFLAIALQCTCLVEWAASQSCGPRVSPRLLREIPCDMNSVAYCTQPGSAYPWSAVRRYIFDNQGFMKRMYGEHRQSQVIREEMLRMNDLYETPDMAAFRSAKSAEEAASGQSANIVLLNTTTESGTRPGELENVTTMESELEPEVWSTTVGDSAAGLYASSALPESGAEERDGATTPSAETDNLLGGEEQRPTTAPKGYNACPVTQEVVAPYWANNTRGETLALLNVYPFEQYIHWEKCSFEGEQMMCREGCKCEQQYRLHRLLAFDPRNECRGIFADWFRFPGCCVCICYDALPTTDNHRINNRKARL